MHEWVLLFEDLNIVTRHEYNVLLKLATDPRLEQNARILKQFAWTSNKRNETSYRRDFGLHYLKDQSRYGRTSMLQTLYWSTFILYFYHQPMNFNRRITKDEFICEYINRKCQVEDDEKNGSSSAGDGEKNGELKLEPENGPLLEDKKDSISKINNIVASTDQQIAETYGYHRTHNNQYFQEIDDLEIERLVQYRNLLTAAFIIIPPKRSEVLAMRAVAVLERSGLKYPFTPATTASTQHSSVGGKMIGLTRRKIIYQREMSKYMKFRNEEMKKK